MEIQTTIPVPADVDETLRQKLDKAEDAVYKLSTQYFGDVILPLYDVYRSKNNIFLSFFLKRGLIQIRYCGLLIFPCSLTTQLECIAATFI